MPSGGGGGGSSGSAYEGSAAAIPGTIEVERFDYGGEGIAYSDTDAGNNGGVRRWQDDGGQIFSYKPNIIRAKTR